MKENRKYVRRSNIHPVEFVIESRCFKGLMLDLSAGGAFIQTQGSFSVGEKISLIYQSGASATTSYCQMLCMALGGDPFFTDTVNEFYSSDYFPQPLRMM
jgi:hypothetical protein